MKELLIAKPETCQLCGLEAEYKSRTDYGISLYVCSACFRQHGVSKSVAFKLRKRGESNARQGQD